MALKETEEVINNTGYEAPRYSCSLGGAYSAALAVFGAVPILHSGAGCGLGQQFGQHYAAGQNAGGPQGTTNTPCSCLVEEHVIFGGENKLRELIKSSIEIMEGDFFTVLSGCVPSLIGDDVDSVVKEFRDQVPIVHINTPGFNGNSYDGYELFFQAVIDQLLTPLPKEKGLVNILGIVPYQHVFWKGDLAKIKETLAKIGLKANIIFTDFDGLNSLKKIPAAELNLVLSPWNGHQVAEKLKDKFNTPYLVIPGVPVGPKETSKLLYAVAEELGVAREVVEKVVQEEERRVYRFTEYLGDILVLGLPHAYYAVVAESSTAIGITKYLNNEIGYLADIVIITDNPPEEQRSRIIQELTEGLESIVKPEIIFEVDSHKIREKLKNRNFLILFGSSLEKHLTGVEFGAIHVSVGFPVYDRLILDRSYAGFEGGLALMEDYVSKYAGSL